MRTATQAAARGGGREGRGGSVGEVARPGVVADCARIVGFLALGGLASLGIVDAAHGQGSVAATRQVVEALADSARRQEPSAPAEQARDSAPGSRARAFHPEAKEAISRIRSPFCPGLMLEVCPSPPAEALRDSLDAQAKDGLRADSLVEMVVASYGEEYRAVPKTSGAGLWAWVMPPVALAAGLGLALVALRRLRAPADLRARPALSDEEQERVRQALADFERGS